MITKRVTKGNIWGVVQSRLYVPISDLRRMFNLPTDDVAPMTTTEGTYYIGLPPEAAAMVGQLWQEGRIVFDCNQDVRVMVVQGLSPVRVLTRGRNDDGTRPVMRTPSRPRPTPTVVTPVPASVGDVPDAGAATPTARPVVRRTRSATTRVPTPETPFEFRPTPPEFVSERPADITRLADMARVAEAEGHAPRGVRVAIPEEQTVAPSDDEASGGSGGDDGSRRRRRGGIGRSTRARSV
ncbi:MAG: hypothetical protein EBQ56_06825 [Proteobacteria bacterium]|jgi:hypothetical protein|nr:hypothetical protein [Pseudomonadota bacterium]NBX45620.1 hypothetical protein [Chloroflexota bacterium]NBQ32541.1 hypothetical protein [Pseudomonadota bacterium]NBQ60997.1 hypothetical protein [Pseudomonadota bacterium]NBT03645.1 hypothetical protein [Pseudomonadota bacterium]